MYLSANASKAVTTVEGKHVFIRGDRVVGNYLLAPGKYTPAQVLAI